MWVTNVSDINLSLFNVIPFKKSPLVIPPDFNELPIPKEQEEKIDLKKNKFKTLITKENLENKPDNNKDVNKSLKESLLEKIKNN